ncbi:MAG: SwmB domain-containing protein [Candidatus Nitrosoabyssus spongiisocia]|nr:MAG: SwmB domain-containing protein [Nitrosopumilaceae archaeon AB1(1)]
MSTTNNAGNTITLTFNENIVIAGTVPNSDFTFTNTNANVSSTSRTSPTQIQLLLDTTVLANETGVTLSYTNSSNFITDLNGTALANVINQNVNNMVPKTSPTITDIVTNQAGNTLTLTLDESVILINSTSSDFTINISGVTVNDTSVLSDDSMILLTLDGFILIGQNANLSYTPTTTTITDGNGTALESFNNYIRNEARNASMFVSATTTLDGGSITILFSENITLDSNVVGSQFTFRGTTTTSTSQISSTNDTITLVLGTRILANETVTISYSGTPGTINNSVGVLLADFENNSVINNVTKTPPLITSATTNGAGNTITLTFNENIVIAGTVPNSDFTFTNTNANVSSTSRTSPTQIQLLLDTPVLANETGVTLSYTNSSNFITDLNGTALGNVAGQSISNIIPKTPPLITSATTNNAGNTITLTFNENIVIAGTVPNSDFTFTNTNANVSSTSRTSPTQIQLVLDTPVLTNEIGITLTFTNSSNNITDLNGTALGNASFPLSTDNIVIINVTISTTISTPTNSDSIPVTITFSEDVTGFVSSDITIFNANVTNFTGSGAIYTADLIPPTSFDGNITVSVPANVANNASSIPNIASNVLSVIYDSVAPTITISNTTIHTYRAVDNDDSLSVMQYGLGVQCSDSTLFSYTENISIAITGFTELCFSTTDSLNNTNFLSMFVNIPTIQSDSILVHEDDTIVGFDIDTTAFIQIQPNIQNIKAHFINATDNITLNSNLTVLRIGVDNTAVPTNITLLMYNTTTLQYTTSFILLDFASLVIPPTPTLQYTTISSTLIGLADDSINFTSPIRITFTDQAGKSFLPYYQETPNHAPVLISTICASANDIQQIESQLNGSGECTIDHESDVIIWTYHATVYGLVSARDISSTTTSIPFLSVGSDNSIRSSGGGSVGGSNGGGSLIDSVSIGDSTSVSSPEFTLYEISWSTINSEKIVEVVIGPPSDNIFATINGKLTDITSIPSPIQPYLNRVVYVGSIDLSETVISVRVGTDTDNSFSTVHKLIDVSQSEGSITYDSSTTIPNPIIPFVPPVEPVIDVDVVDEMPKIEEELEEIKPVVEPIVEPITEPISLDDIPDTDDPMTTGGCLVATAAYGTELSQQVQLLREIRDVTLMNTVPGSTFMTSFNQIYYTFSPIVADAERENPLLRNIVQSFLYPVLSSLSILTTSDGSDDNILYLGLIVIFINLLVYICIPICGVLGIRRILHYKR